MKYTDLIQPVKIANFQLLEHRKPTHALVENTDLVIIKYNKGFSVLYGRCLHRGAMLADGHVDDRGNLICGLHQWDYRIDTGVSEYNNSEALYKFKAVQHKGHIYVDRADVIAFEELHPQAFKRDQYLGAYADTHPENTEPYTSYIHELARNGLKKIWSSRPFRSNGGR